MALGKFISPFDEIPSGWGVYRRDMLRDGYRLLPLPINWLAGWAWRVMWKLRRGPALPESDAYNRRMDRLWIRAEIGGNLACRLSNTLTDLGHWCIANGRAETEDPQKAAHDFIVNLGLSGAPLLTILNRWYAQQEEEKNARS